MSESQQEKIDQALALYSQHKSTKIVAELMGVTSRQVRRYLRSAGIDRPTGRPPASITTPNYPPNIPKPIHGSPEPDTFGRLILPILPETVLVIPDLQAPFQHPDALPFLSMVAQSYTPDCVIGIGDELDMQFLSKFDKFPELDEPKRELERGIEFLGELFRLFPRAHALTSNHVHGRLQSARRVGRLPPQMLVPWQTLAGAPAGWEWYEEVHMGDVLFRHGDKWSRLTSSHLLRDIPRYYGRHMSVVHGHLHEQHGRVADTILVGDDEYWAAYSGALIDVRSKAFDYVKAPKTRLGCLVIVKGTPHRIPLRRDDHGRWTGRL